MKRFSAALIVVVLSFFLSACDTQLSADRGDKPEQNKENNQQKQVSLSIADSTTGIDAPELTVRTDQSRFGLYWDSSDDIAYYQVYWSVHSDPQAASLISSSAKAGYQGTLEEGTNNYWIKACTQVGCSAFSNMVSVTRSFAVPVAVTEYSAYRSTDDPTRVSLGWRVPASHTEANGVDITYRVYRHTSDNSADAVGSLVFQGRSSVFIDTGLDAATSYYYWIEACTAAVCSQWSGSAAAEAVEAVAPASAPVLSLVSAEGSVTLSWNQADDVTYYKIYRDTISNPSEQRRQRRLIAVQDATADNSYQDLTVSASTTYYYWVKACNTGICSAVSNVVEAVVPEAPELGVPVLSVDSNDDDPATATVRWTEVTGATYYQVYRGTRNDPAAVMLKASPLASEGTSYSAPVSAATSWYYLVKACDSNGCSDYSNVSEVAKSAQRLNDTGITWGGDYSRDNNGTCAGQDETVTPATNLPPQDCHQGRDYTHNDDSNGHAGFRFTRLNANGNEYTGSGTYSSEPWACVRDDITGLIWEVKTDDDGTHDKDNSYKWGGITAATGRAGDYHDDWNSLVNWSRSQALCGYTDWRVPTPDELLSITHTGRNRPSIDTNYFPNTGHGDSFWSSMPFAINNRNAWVISFRYGSDGITRRDNDEKVRLVRGDSIGNDWSDSRYTVHSNGTVTDTRTGLMWKRCAEGLRGANCASGKAKGVNWKEALVAAQNSGYAGYNDWRLPNRNELASLVARDRASPAINSSVFPNTPASWRDGSHWSSSPFGPLSHYSWGVYFGSGYDHYDSRELGSDSDDNDIDYSMRLVRGGQ